MALEHTIFRQPPDVFFKDSGLEAKISSALNDCYSAQPQNPLKFVAEHLRQNVKSGTVNTVKCYPRLDGTNFILGLSIETAGGESAEVGVRVTVTPTHPNPVRDTVPQQIKAGDKTARDELCRVVEIRLTGALRGASLVDQGGLDSRLQQEDGTENFASLGSNITAAASLGVLVASSRAVHKPTFFNMLALQGGRNRAVAVPLPVVTLFGCGDPKHFGKLRVLEVCAIPSAALAGRDAASMLARLSEETLKKIGEDSVINADGSVRYMSFDSPLSAIDFAEEIIKDAGFAAGVDVNLGIVVDAAWCYKIESQKYSFADSLPELSGAQLAELLATLCRDKKSVSYIEDPLHASDATEFRRLMARVGSQVSVACINTFGGSAVAAQHGVSNLTCNTVGAKLDECGTLTAMTALLGTANSASGIARCCAIGSLTSPEIADVATGANCRYLRVGGLHRGVASSVLNRLVDIESELKSMGMLVSSPNDPHSRCALPPPPAEPVVDVQAKTDKKKK